MKDEKNGKSLVEIARSVPAANHMRSGLPYTRECFDLALAWIRCEVSSRQAAVALKLGTNRYGSVIYALAQSLRNGAERGWWKP